MRQRQTVCRASLITHMCVTRAYDFIFLSHELEKSLLTPDTLALTRRVDRRTECSCVSEASYAHL
jgi:hypothetical protein